MFLWRSHLSYKGCYTNCFLEMAAFLTKGNNLKYLPPGLLQPQAAFEFLFLFYYFLKYCTVTKTEYNKATVVERASKQTDSGDIWLLLGHETTFAFHFQLPVKSSQFGGRVLMTGRGGEGVVDPLLSCCGLGFIGGGAAVEVFQNGGHLLLVVGDVPLHDLHARPQQSLEGQHVHHCSTEEEQDREKSASVRCQMLQTVKY